MSTEALIAVARKTFHERLLRTVLTVDKSGVPSNADSSNKLSIRIARSVSDQLLSEIGTRLAAQTSGHQFELIITQYLEESFLPLGHLRPGQWQVARIGNRNHLALAQFEQYAHLSALAQAAERDPQLAAALGNDYTITPDIVVFQHLLSDATLNQPFIVVDDSVSLLAAIRRANGGKPLLHASISAKWTIRSDRSQNTRAEALNLIRNRKGHLPHVIAVTGEPLPSRLASIALGTGDIDCVYHFALPELRKGIEEAGAEDALEMMAIMVDGHRLKDISDLPLDLIP